MNAIGEASVSGRESKPNIALLLVLSLALLIGLFVPYLPLEYVVVASFGALLLVVSSVNVELLVGSWIFSVIFYAYRLDIGAVTLNPYRAVFMVLIAISVFRLNVLKVRRLKVYVFASALFMLFLVNLLRSLSSSVALSSFLNNVFGLGTLVYLVQFVNSERQRRLVTNAYLASSVIVAGYGVYQGMGWFLTGQRLSLPLAQYASEEIAFKTSVVKDLGLPRVESFFNDSNLLGVYLVVAILIMISRLQEGTRSILHRTALIGAILVEILCVLFTASRSAGLLLVASLLLLQFSQKRSPKRFVKWCIGAVAVASMTVTFYSTVPVVSSYFDAIASRLAVGVDARRLELGRGGWEAFRESPLIGVGLANLESQVGVYTTHSFYVTVLAKYGLIGALVVGGLLLPLVRESIHTLLSARSRDEGLGFAAATMALLTYQVVYDNLFSELMWLPFSILYLWALRCEQKREVRLKNV